MNGERLPDGGGGTGGDGAWTDGAAPASDERSITAAAFDSLFEILASRQRRRLLAYLEGTDDGVATVSELADRVADATDESDAVAIHLHHVHLPKLANAGVVEYDPRSETVRYRGDETVTAWVEFVRQ